MRQPPETSSESPKPKAYSYLRFSTPEQREGDSFRRQSSMATNYAARKGLDLDTGLPSRSTLESAVSGMQGPPIDVM